MTEQEKEAFLISLGNLVESQKVPTSLTIALGSTIYTVHNSQFGQLGRREKNDIGMGLITSFVSSVSTNRNN